MSGPSFALLTDSLLAEGLSVKFRAAGRSMLPTVRDGECVTVAPVDARDVSIGDVIFCYTRRGALAHRVLEIATSASGARAFSTRGDASDELDRPVGAEQVRGRVISVDRGGHTLGLAIAGGWLGRRAFVAGLRLRSAVAAIARAAVAAARAPSIAP